jgi:hypothetical protein
LGITDPIITNNKGMEKDTYEIKPISFNRTFKKTGVTIRYLFTQWYRLLLISLIGALCGFMYAKFSKKVYTAELTFALTDGGEKAGGIGSIASQFGIDIGSNSGGVFSGDNVMELMKSRKLVEKTLLTEADSAGRPKMLINEYIERVVGGSKSDKSLPVYFKKDQNLDNKTRFLHDSFLNITCFKLVKNNLRVTKKDKKLAIVNVTFKSTSEWFSKNFTELLTQNVIEYYIETKTGRMRRNVKMMEQKADSIKNVLNAAMYGIADEMDANHYLVRGVGKVPQAKKQLEIQVLTILYGELIKNLEMNRALMEREQPLMQIIDTPRYPLIFTKTRKSVGVIIGGLSSLLLGIMLLIGQSKLKNGIND